MQVDTTGLVKLRGSVNSEGEDRECACTVHTIWIDIAGIEWTVIWSDLKGE
jgi:hypothetical protein